VFHSTDEFDELVEPNELCSPPTPGRSSPLRLVGAEFITVRFILGFITIEFITPPGVITKFIITQQRSFAQ
jgi:hypothetical protein